MASKKEPKARAKQARAGKDTAKAAPKKAKAGKAPKKAAAKAGTGKSESKRDTAKQHKIPVPVGIRVPVAAGNKEADGAAEAGMDPFEVAKQRVKGSVPAIVEAMVEKAKQGSCSHAKTLLEMTGAKHMFDGEGEAEDLGEPWAKLVLERLDEAKEESASLHEAERESTVEQ